MADIHTSRKKRSIIFPILASLLLIFFLGLFFLPNILSTDWAGSKIKQVASSRLPGQVDFEKLSLSWLNGVQCRGITYGSRAEGLLVKVADITIPKGLLGLAINYKELGLINIKDPKVSVYLDEKAAVEKQDGQIANKTPQKNGTSQPGRSEKKNGPILLPPFGGKLSITGGTVTAVYPNAKEKLVLKDLKFLLTVDGSKNLLDYLVGFQAGDGAGRVNGEGTITLPAGDITNLAEIQSQAVLDIENWELTDVLSVLGSVTGIPTGSGQLNGHMGVSGSTKTALQIKGNLVGHQIKLRGGFLKTDTPSLENVEVKVDGEQVGSILTINKLALISSLGTGTASGSFDSLGKKEVAGSAVVDLAQVFAQFPDTLNLKKGIKISQGKIDIKAKVNGVDKNTFFDGSIYLKKLQGVAGKKKLAWNKPVTLEIRGKQSPEGLQLENFTVQSAFLNGKGQGNINQMKVQLTADIGLALKEIEKFIQLEGWKSSGKMDLNLQVETKTESLRSLAGDIRIKDFMLQQKDRIIAPRHTLKANLATDMRLDEKMRLQETVNTTVDFQTWAGSGAATLKSFIPPFEQASVQLKDLGLKSSFNLNQVTALLQILSVLPENTRLAGKVDLDTLLSMKENMIELDSTTMNIEDFLFQDDKQKFSEEKIHLATRGSADLNKKTVTLKPVEIKTSAGRIAFPELLITDWSQLKNGIKAKGSIDLNLGPLTTLLGDVLKLSPGTVVSGPAAIKLNIDLTDTQQQVVQLDGTVGPVKVSSKDKLLLSEDSIGLAIDLQGDLNAQNFRFSKVELSSLPVTLGAAGRVVSDKKEHLLTTEGSISLDLEALSDYLKSLADLEIEMTGSVKKPFSIKVKSTGGKWVDMPKNTDLSTSFHADTIRGFGMNIKPLDISIQLADSLAEIDIKGNVNGGKMGLKPAINFSADSPVISIPENTSILTGVGLADGSSGDHLAKVHPIFNGAVITQGSVDLDMQSFSWPLDKAARKDAEFVCSLTFHDVKLQTGGLLTELFEIMKANEREITLDDKPMECVGKNDRVLCSPLEIKTKEYSITLTGSVGFDQSLDYEVRLPVTEKMVGRDGYKYLQGTFITVPIGGTVSHPSLSKNFVEDAIADLIIQAGQKQITEQAGKLLEKLFK